MEDRLGHVCGVGKAKMKTLRRINEEDEWKTGFDIFVEWDSENEDIEANK